MEKEREGGEKKGVGGTRPVPSSVGCLVAHGTDEAVLAMFGAAPAAVGERRTQPLLGGGRRGTADQRQCHGQQLSVSIHTASHTVCVACGVRQAPPLMLPGGGNTGLVAPVRDQVTPARDQ